MAKPAGGDIEGRIGFDDRGFILDTMEPPYSAICMIRADWPDGQFQLGTGVIFGERMVITVAHNIYRHDGAGMAATIQAVPGVVGRDAPFAWAKIRGSSARVHPAYLKEKKDLANDLAALLLPGPLGLRTGWSDLAPIEVTPGLQILATGYAGDYYRDTGEYRQAQAGGVMSGEYYYGLAELDADYYVGASGGPIWRASDSSPYVMTCGLIEAEYNTEEKPGGVGGASEFNLALMFTWAHYDWIQARLRESMGLSFADWDRKALSVDTTPRPYRKPKKAVRGTGPVAKGSSHRKWIEASESGAEGEPHMAGGKSEAEDGTLEVKATKPKKPKAPPPAPDSFSFTVPSRGRHEIAVNLRAGDLVVGKVEIALPGGSFTDCELALVKGRAKIDRLPMFVSSSGPKDFHKDRFSFAAASDGEYRLVFRELNGSGAASVRLTLKAPA